MPSPTPCPHVALSNANVILSEAKDLSPEGNGTVTPSPSQGESQGDVLSLSKGEGETAILSGVLSWSKCLSKGEGGTSATAHPGRTLAGKSKSSPSSTNSLIVRI